MEERKIENPWAVYEWYAGSFGIGKIIQESSNSVWIEYCEGQQYPPACWDSKWVKRFDSPAKSISYFLVHQLKNSEESYNEKEAINLFLRNFPNERKNIAGIVKN